MAVVGRLLNAIQGLDELIASFGWTWSDYKLKLTWKVNDEVIGWTKSFLISRETW